MPAYSSWVSRLGVLLAAVVSLAPAAAAPASAHTDLVSSSPDKGASGPTPQQVELTFNQEMTAAGASLIVRDAAGAEHQQGAVAVDGMKVRRGVMAGVPAGSYTIAYRVISADGHPVTGEVAFTVTAPDPGAGPVAAMAPHDVAPPVSPGPAASSAPASAPAASARLGGLR